MQQIQVQSQQVNEVMNTDLTRTLFQMRILSMFQTMMLDYDHLPEKIAWSFQWMNEEIKAVEHLILAQIPAGTYPALETKLESEKLLDIAGIYELVGRIGVEEKEDIYEEFLTLLMGCINSVFYAQTNRKRLHFGKYRKLFHMVESEIKADTNKEMGQVYYRNGEIYMRSVPPTTNHQLK